jgi:HSP20 family protein
MTEERRRPDWGPAFGRLDRMFEDWFRSHPIRRSTDSVWGEAMQEPVRLDEYRDGDVLVVRADLPGVDPERDVDVTVADRKLTISGERRLEGPDREYARRELRYGQFSRSLPLPDEAREDGIAATYRDGVLELRIPLAAPTRSEPTRITVTRPA